MNLLEFANPIGWWAALLAVPVVLLYILKTRLRRRQVSTLLFWDKVFEENRPRAWWQQLRRLMSLLLQLLFLLLLVSALVDPLWSWQQRRQRRVVLVMDNSASMQAKDADGATRFELAQQSARALVRSLRGSDQMALLTAGGTPRVAMGLTDHQNSLLEAIDAMPATDGPTSVQQAIATAKRLLTGAEGENEIIVLTDACYDDQNPPDEATTEATPPDGEQPAEDSLVTIYGIGESLDNVGITRYQVRRTLLDAVGYQVLVDVTNFSEEEAQCRLELTLEEDLVDVIPLTLTPGETVTRVIDHTSASGGQLLAKLDIDDALAVDNTALALLPRRDPVPVVLVSQGNLFLQSVLQSIPLVDLKIAENAPASAPAGGVMVIDRKVPEKLPAGMVLVVDPQGSCDQWEFGEAIAEPIVAEVDADSPLTQHVRLTNVLFPEAHSLTFKSEPQLLIQDPLENPLLARLPRPGGDALVLSCSLEKGDLPLRIAFPVLMKNAIEWFQGAAGDLRPATPSGQMVTVRLDALANAEKPKTEKPEDIETSEDDIAVVESAQKKKADRLVLVSPSNKETPLVATDAQASIGPLQETGQWVIRRMVQTESAEDEPAPQVAVACNLASPAESDLRPRAAVTDIKSLRLLSLGGHSLWFYLTFFATGLITAEWWLYQRRIVE